MDRLVTDKALVQQYIQSCQTLDELASKLEGNTYMAHLIDQTMSRGKYVDYQLHTAEACFHEAQQLSFLLSQYLQTSSNKTVFEIPRPYRLLFNSILHEAFSDNPTFGMVTLITNYGTTISSIIKLGAFYMVYNMYPETAQAMINKLDKTHHLLVVISYTES